MNWKSKALLVFFTAILVIPFMSIAIRVNIATASSTNKIYVDPSSTVDLSLDPGDTFTVDINVDYVEDFWQWQFDLTFDPDVIRGVWYNETEGYPVEPDPEGFLASGGGTLIISGGSGWNNTTGKLWLTSANLLLKLNPVTGGGVLARVTFEVVAKGESDIILGDLSALFDLDGIIETDLEHGYFRNVDSALIPTASFTHSPIDTPDSLEGYYTRFNGTDSTAPSGKTIDEYKWYFWETLHQELFGPIANASVTTFNYTRRGVWNVTLTVVDSEGVVASTTGYVTIKAHDLAVIDVATDAKTGNWPVGVRYVDIGDFVSINVTIENLGDFPETSNVTVSYFLAAPGVFRADIIDIVDLGGPLAAGDNTTVTVQWDTEGHNVTHPFEYMINANVSHVQYEYFVADNHLDLSTSVRVRFHDVAVTEIEAFPHVVLRPDGDGTFTGWTGAYTDWDDWPTHNGDVDYVSAAADALNESSTIEDHTVETWSIERIRVTIIAKTDLLPVERVVLLLIIGGQMYLSPANTLTQSYSEYSYDWSANPATGSDWTWQDIDALEVGVQSEAVGAWTGEIRVTQLYVEVFGTLPGPVSLGESVTVRVTVKNEGDFTETDVSVTAYYDGDTIGTQNIPLITNSSYGKPPNFPTSNFTTTMAFHWNTSGISLDDYVLSAEAELVPDEYEPDDNTLLDGHLNVTYVRLPSTISIAASPSSVLVGENVTLSGAIDPVRVGKTVTLWHRLSGAATWSNVTAVLTDASGEYAYNWTAMAPGTYEFKASWLGDGEYAPAASDVVNATVTGKMSSSLSMAASPTSIEFGEETALSGALTPAQAGANITIQYRLGGAATWSNVTAVLTDASGEYAYNWTATGVGTYRFRATWPGDDDYLSAESDSVTVVVNKTSSSVLIAISPSSIVFGHTATLSGGLDPARAGATVTVYLRPAGTTTWNDIATFQTDANGEYSYVVSLNSPGNFELMVSWAGTANIEGAQSDAVSLTVTEAEPVDLTLPIVAVVVIIIVAVVAIYFLKIRK